MTEPSLPVAGELIWLVFDPTRGREQSGRRPALVISATDFTRFTGYAIVCPITMTVRPFPTSVVLSDGDAIRGEILVSHVRSVDLLARAWHSAGAAVSTAVLDAVHAKLGMILGRSVPGDS